MPQPCTPVLAIQTIGRSSTACKDDAHDHEDDDSSQFQYRDEELLLGVSEHAEDADDDNHEEEYGDPDGHVDLESPVCDCETGDDEFEWKDDSPLESV